MNTLKLNKAHTDAILNQAIALTTGDLSDLNTIDAVYNVSKKAYITTMKYDTELMQNDLIVMIPLGLFTHIDEKSARNNIIDTFMNRHFQAMMHNDLLTI